MDKDIYVTQQYCPYVEKNISLQTIFDANDISSIKCLNSDKCEVCHNKFVTNLINQANFF